MCVCVNISGRGSVCPLFGRMLANGYLKALQKLCCVANMQRSCSPIGAKFTNTAIMIQDQKSILRHVRNSKIPCRLHLNPCDTA